MEAITLLVWPKTHISIEIKLPTIPTAPSDIVAFSGILPTIIVSVIDNIGSAIPEIKAGIASFCMSEILIDFVKLLIHSNKKETHSALENRFFPIADILLIRKILSFFYSLKMYLNVLIYTLFF